ncbi:hypothetical protein F4777DRAFT_550457 [Nemania sp. FL0916]|nr:hypothetical protein F4777DRAFT_550457 [Nemania sp. FL0916]
MHATFVMLTIFLHFSYQESCASPVKGNGSWATQMTVGKSPGAIVRATLDSVPTDPTIPPNFSAKFEKGGISEVPLCRGPTVTGYLLF